MKQTSVNGMTTTVRKSSLKLVSVAKLESSLKLFSLATPVTVSALLNMMASRTFLFEKTLIFF